MVIDFHTHLFPDKLAERAIKELASRCKQTPEDGGTVTKTRALMEKEGVDISVVQNIATNPRQMHNVNTFAIELDREPDFVSFGSVHYEGDWEYELDFLKDGGIKGIKLHPDYQGFYVNDVKMQPIYEGILKRGFILMFHSGLDMGLPVPVHCTPERAHDTLGLFRDEKVIFSHSGSFGMWDEAEKYILGEDIYIDTSMTNGFLDKAERERIYKLHDSSKILFGTDMPWGGFKKEIDALCALDFDDEWKEKVFYKNAIDLLGF